MFSEMLSMSYSAFWNYFLQIKSSLLRKKKTVVEKEKLLLCFSLLHLHGKGLLPTTAGPLTWHWLSNVSLGGALHAGGVLFCGHFNHTVEAIIRIRPDRATQVLLPGLSWSGNLCQPPVETPHLQQAAHTSWLPQECWKYSNNQYRSLWHSRVAKEARIYSPSQRQQGEKLCGKSCPPCRGWTTLQLLSGTSQTRCHQPVWDRLPLPSSTQLCGQDHFQLHPTTLLGFSSFNFLLIQLVSYQFSQKSLFIHFAVENSLCPSLLAYCSTWHCTALWVKRYEEWGKEILLPYLCSNTQSWIRSSHQTLGQRLSKQATQQSYVSICAHLSRRDFVCGVCSIWAFIWETLKLFCS